MQYYFNTESFNIVGPRTLILGTFIFLNIGTKAHNPLPPRPKPRKQSQQAGKAGSELEQEY